MGAHGAAMDRPVDRMGEMWRAFWVGLAVFYWDPFIFVGCRGEGFFSHADPCILGVARRCRCSPMLIFRAWDTCAFSRVLIV